MHDFIDVYQFFIASFTTDPFDLSFSLFLSKSAAFGVATFDDDNKYPLM